MVMVHVHGQIIGRSRQAAAFVVVGRDAVVVPNLPPTFPPSTTATKILLLLLITTQMDRQMMRRDLRLLPVLPELLLLQLTVLTVGMAWDFSLFLRGIEEGSSNNVILTE